MLFKTHRRTSDNTMAKTNKDKQCYTKHIEERQTIPWPKPTRTNNVTQNTSTNVRKYHGQNQQDKQCYAKHIEECQTIPVPKPTRTNNVIKNTSENVRQYHGQNKQGQTMLYKTHRRTSDNTMAKTNKDKPCYTKHIEERQTISWPKPTRTNHVIQNTSKNVRQYHGQNQQGQTMLYKTHQRTSENAMAKTSKDKLCYAKYIEECQTIPVPKPTRTNNVIQHTSKNVRQYHGQNQQGQTMLCKTHRRTSDTTMAKTKKDKQCYTKHIEERQTLPWPKPTRTNKVIQNTSKNVRQYHGQNKQGQTILYKTHRRTSDNTMVKTNKQCNIKHIEERQTIPWPKPTRTNNVMQSTSKNVRHYHGQNQQGQTMLYKTHRRTSDNTMDKTNKDKQCYSKHIEECQTIPWPKPTRTNNVIQNTSKNVRQYHGQNQQGQTMLYKTHRITSDNTMAKANKD